MFQLQDKPAGDQDRPTSDQDRPAGDQDRSTGGQDTSLPAQDRPLSASHSTSSAPQRGQVYRHNVIRTRVLWHTLTSTQAKQETLKHPQIGGK